MASISLKNVYKVYDGGVTAVKDFNMEINDKEFIVFVGPSGCGKTTTLRMIAGLEKITAGDIYIDNVRINDLEPRDRDIAMVFQNYALYPHKTVYQNMAFSLKIKKSKVPVYESSNYDEIVKSLGSNHRKLRKLNKTFSKTNDEKIHQEILELEKEIRRLEVDLKTVKENLKQVTFKDVQAIKDTKSTIAFYENQIKIIEEYIKKCERNLTNTDDEEAIEKFKSNIDKCQKRINDFEEAIALEKQNLEFLENNEVPMYRLQHLSSQEIDKRVKEVAKMLEIENLLDRKPKALSGGQRQRVAIGRAIVRNAKVFLMDEPLSNLDAKLRNQMRAELILLRKKINATFIYVTHDQTEAMTLGDRIVIMKDGVVQQIGTPQQLFNHPSNLFVAGFIGSPQMNFINASITGDIKLDILGKQIELTSKNKALLEKENVKGVEIVLGIRPEHLLLSSEENPNALEGTVSVVELMGSSMHVHIETENNKNVVMIVPITNYDSNIYEEIVAGKKIYFSWNIGLEHLFSKETEENLIKFEQSK